MKAISSSGTSHVCRRARRVKRRSADRAFRRFECGFVRSELVRCAKLSAFWEFVDTVLTGLLPIYSRKVWRAS